MTIMPIRLKADMGERGIALLMVIWVLVILTVIVLSFSYMSRTETNTTMAFRDGITRKFLAEAGVQKGIMEIIYKRINMNAPAEEGKEAWRFDGTPYTVKTDQGSFTVSITDESGKVDINQINDANSDILRNLLGNLGVAKEDSDTIVDSMMDWIDADDLHHTNGVESDYYESLPHPYKAKNDKLDTVEELLLVKGMTPDILYGKDGKKGLIDFITVNSKSRSVNAAAAPKEVLMAFPGITPETADEIINLREGAQGGQSGMQAITGLLANVSPPYKSFLRAWSGGTVFTIEAQGSTGGAKRGYALKATVSLDGNNSYHYLYYKSPAEVRTTGNDTDTAS